MNNGYTIERLDNGLRVVIEVMPDAPSAAAGFLVRTGARDETADAAGVSHFLEHMMFKGTATRTWHDINVEFDRLGSTYNAFTSNDRTFYYGWVPSENVKPQIALLADMMRSALPPDEFDMEKNVILEEIARAKDNLVSVAFDVLMEKAFRGHSLAWPILGYDHTVRDLTREQMHAYFQRRYAPDNMILIVAGAVDPDDILAHARELCGSWAPSRDSHRRDVPTLGTGLGRQKIDRFQQQVIMVGYPASPGADDEAETAQMFATILGGENSRFFWNVIQKGICPRAGAFHLDFADIGIMILWAMCEPSRVPQAYEAMLKEAEILSRQGARPDEVERVRNKRRTGLVYEAEAPFDRLKQIMDDVDYRGKPRTVEERLDVLDRISIDTLSEYSERYPLGGEGFLISVGPGDWPEEGEPNA